MSIIHSFSQPRLLVLGSNSRSSSEEDPSPGENATTHLLRVVRRATISPSLFARNRQTLSGNRAGQRGGAPNRGGGFGTMSSFAGAPGDRRGRINLNPAPPLLGSTPIFDRSSVNTVSTVVPPARRPSYGQAGSNWAVPRTHDVFLSDEEDDDDDDDSDLGVPLGSTTPTLTSGNNVPGTNTGLGLGLGGLGYAGEGARWGPDRERAFLDTLRSPLVQEGFEASPAASAAGRSRSAAHVHEYETDDEEDYGQPVVRTILLMPVKYVSNTHLGQS